MFVVQKLTRGYGKKDKGQIITAVPVGTSLALSDNHIFPASHNFFDEKYIALLKIGVVQVYEYLV